MVAVSPAPSATMPFFWKSVIVLSVSETVRTPASVLSTTIALPCCTPETWPLPRYGSRMAVTVTSWTSPEELP
jgi:hypothetical protein